MSSIKSVFDKLDLEYISTNNWDNIPKAIRKSSEIRVQGRIHGVEPRKLEHPHPLAGEYGLFASTKRFEMCDVVGEYCGVVTTNNEGHYCASLDFGQSLYCVDAEFKGNEMRFINDFHGIKDSPNVTMRICHVDSIPRILIVCLRTIEIGEELLLSYGDLYCAKHFNLAL